MTIRIPTLAAFTLTSNEERTQQPLNNPLNNLGAAIHSLRLVQALCWLLVFIL